MVFMDGLAKKSKLTKFYYLVIIKVNQEMLDNDANLQEANEDKVDEKIPETEAQPKQEMTQSESLTEKGGIENIEDQQGENITSEDSTLDEEESSMAESEEESYEGLNLEQLLKSLDKKVSSGRVHHHKNEVEALCKQIEPKLSQIFEKEKRKLYQYWGRTQRF